MTNVNQAKEGWPSPSSFESPRGARPVPRPVHFLVNLGGRGNLLLGAEYVWKFCLVSKHGKPSQWAKIWQVS
jgi:hypothetical protein